MPESRYWLVLPNGGRQRIDPSRFDLAAVGEQARRIGARLVVEAAEPPPTADPPRFEPPASALSPLFKARLSRIYKGRVDFVLDINERVTTRVLGGYYRRTRVVRVYSRDRLTGRRPIEELFDTFLHEVAHHLEYTEPDTFRAAACQRVPGRMHSPLFWRILGDLKSRWVAIQAEDRGAM